jgi:DNA-directed RNA polymerase specialized sigma24 family protein
LASLGWFDISSLRPFNRSVGMNDDPRGSVTQLIADLQVGDDSLAQQQIWERYFRRIVSLARVKLGNSPRGCEDEEDVALSALQSLFHGISDQRFPELRDRDNLWSLLATMTARKAINQRNRQLALKRGGNQRQQSTDVGHAADLMQLMDDEIGPELLVAIQEECQRLMDKLPDDTLRQIARWKLEGWTNAEAAEKLSVAERTIERKLGLIRSIWSQPADN